MWMAFALAVPALVAHAQVFKCQQGGRTVYSDHACEGAQVLDEQRLRTNALPRAPQPPAGRTAAPVVEQHAPVASNCPTEQDISNMKTSASSNSLSADDRTLAAEDISRAQACQPLMTASERDSRLAEMKAARRPLVCSGAGGNTMFCR